MGNERFLKSTWGPVDSRYKRKRWESSTGLPYGTVGGVLFIEAMIGGGSLTVLADWSLRPRTDHQNAVLTLLLRVAKIAQQAVDRQHSAVQNKNEKTHHYNPSPGTSR